MTDTTATTATGAQPSTVNQPPDPAGESREKEPQDFTAAIDTMEESDIAGLLFGGTPAPASPEPSPARETPTATTAAPEPQTSAAAAGDTPQQQDAAPGTPATESQPKAPDRLRLTPLDPDDRDLNYRAVEMVRNKEAANLVEAILALTGKTPTETAAAQGEPEPSTPAPQSAPPRQDDPDVSRIASELQTLRSQREAAIAEYDRAAEIKLTSEIEDKLVELQEAKIEARHRATAEAQRIEQHRAAVAKVKETYPESQDPDSAFSQAMADEIDLATYRRDPILDYPDHLVRIAERVARRLGTATTAQPAPSQPAPVRQAVPVGMGATGNGQRAQMSRDQLTALIEDADEETLLEALRPR